MKHSSTFFKRTVCSVATVAALGGAGLAMAPGAHADTPPRHRRPSTTPAASSGSPSRLVSTS